MRGIIFTLLVGVLTIGMADDIYHCEDGSYGDKPCPEMDARVSQATKAEKPIPEKTEAKYRKAVDLTDAKALAILKIGGSKAWDAEWKAKTADKLEAARECLDFREYFAARIQPALDLLDRDSLPEDLSYSEMAGAARATEKIAAALTLCNEVAQS